MRIEVQQTKSRDATEFNTAKQTDATELTQQSRDATELTQQTEMQQTGLRDERESMISDARAQQR